MSLADDAIVVGGAIALLGLLMTVSTFLLRNGWRFFRKANLFFEDFYGEKGRPGVPARPGVTERLTQIEYIQATQSDLIKKIWDEQMPNHGSSLRDDISRIHETVTGEKTPIAKAYDSTRVTENQNEILGSKGIK